MPSTDLRLGLAQATQLHTVPGLLQTLALVGADREAVEARVDATLAANPMLERSNRAQCPSCGGRRYDGRCPGCPRAGPPAREPTWDPFESLETLALCQVPRTHRAAVPVVMAHLTGRGLLDCAPERIAALHGLPLDSVQAALDAIRTVGPTGIAEATLAEQLARQTRDLVAAGARPWLVDLVLDHLDAIADDDPARVAVALDVPVVDVVEAFALLRRTLRPVTVPTAREPVPAAPDVFVARGEGGLAVDVVDSRWLGLRLVSLPPAVASDAAATAWSASHCREAGELMRQVDARADVLLRVASFAVRHQSAYFDSGPAGHRPLTRTAVAFALGLHPSTVSRAVGGKVVRCPDGRLVAFADLFGGATAVEDVIRRIAATESLSDAQLCVALAAQGHRLARRTVAKYRARLGIAAGRRAGT